MATDMRTVRVEVDYEKQTATESLRVVQVAQVERTEKGENEMKLYRVTDSDLSMTYYQKYSDALGHFQREVDSVQDEPNAYAELSEVKILVNSDTVLRLLNGSGHYEESETVLKRFSNPLE